MATINLNTAATILPTRPHAVYTRPSWADDWTLQPTLIATQAVWSCAPKTPTATLQRFYGGSVLTPGGSQAAASKVDLRGHFVLIEWTADDATLIYWLGYVDSADDHALGSGSGYQLFTCFGLDRALEVTPIASHVWDDDGTATVSDYVPDFNADGKPNRTADKVDGCYLFEPVAEDAEYWSTRDIVEYLLKHQLPTTNGEVADDNPIPWSIDGLTILPDWDTPTVIGDGLSVYDVLAGLIHARRLVGWYVGFDVGGDPADVTALEVRIYSLLAEAQTLGSNTHPANTTQHTIAFASDPLTTGTIRDNGMELCDQIIVRGARRVSLCTLRTGTDELADGWEAADATTYNTGSEAAGIGNKTQDEQRLLHAEARQRPSQRDVFRRLVLSASWDGTALNPETDERHPVFAIPDSSEPHVPAPHAVEILADLPLLSRGDYSGDPTVAMANESGTPRQLLAIFPLAIDDDVVIDAASLGRGGESSFFGDDDPFDEFSLDVQATGREILCTVDGAPQHAIAGDAFTPTGVDNTNYGGWDLHKIEITVALNDDRYCQATEPATITGDADIVRRRVIYAGDTYQQIYIAPGTTVAIDDDGARKLSDGGYLRDDSAKLQQIAKQLAKRHTEPRYDLTLETRRRLSSIGLGNLITEADGQTIDAVVNEIKITAPIAYNDQPIQAPTQTIGTWTGTIDPMATLNALRGKP